MSERSFEIGKPLFAALLICAAAGGAIYWWTTRVTTVEIEEFSVGVPPDWKVTTGDALVMASGFLPEGGTGHIRASYHAADGDSVDWPDEAIRSFPHEPEATESTEIGGRRALLATYNTAGSRSLGVVVDAGSAIVLFQMRCLAKYFDRNRSMFERSARSIRCKKP